MDGDDDRHATVDDRRQAIGRLRHVLFDLDAEVLGGVGLEVGSAEAAPLPRMTMARAARTAVSNDSTS